MLDSRLSCIATLCHGAERIIDVGCDHAFLCAELVRTGAVTHAYASDLREGPLNRARKTIQSYGLEEQITPVLCDGLSAFSPEQADTIVIGGMGGDTIIHILDDAPWVCDGRHTLILQPMSKIPQLRQYLAEHHFRIAQERLAQDNQKLYCAIRAIAGKYTDARHFLFTDQLKPDPLFPLYLKRLEQQQLKIIDGLRIAGLPTTENETLLQIIQANQ